MQHRPCVPALTLVQLPTAMPVGSILIYQNKSEPTATALSLTQASMLCSIVSHTRISGSSRVLQAAQKCGVASIHWWHEGQWTTVLAHVTSQ